MNLFDTHYRIYIWDGGWQRINEAFYTELDDAEADLETLAESDPHSAYCISDGRRLVNALGNLPDVFEMDAHWIGHSNLVGQTLMETARGIAEDLEFGNEAAMLEAAEMLRVLALRMEYYKAYEKAGDKLFDWYLEEKKEIDALLTPRWWHYLLGSNLYGKYLGISLKFSNLRCEALQFARESTDHLFPKGRKNYD